MKSDNVSFVQYCLDYWYSLWYHSIHYSLIILDHLGKPGQIHDWACFQNLRISHHPQLKLKYGLKNLLLLVRCQVLNLCINFHADAHLPRMINNRHTGSSVKLNLRFGQCRILLKQVWLTCYDRWLVIAYVLLFASD